MPINSKYKNLEFDYRISTATVDLEKSNFTKLSGVNRHIMVLKGDVKLQHSNSEMFHLPKLHSYSFDGGIETKSVGKIIDFNLMLRNNIKGEIRGYEINASEKSVEIRSKDFVIYSFDSKIEVCIDEIIYSLSKGELLFGSNLSSKIIVQLKSSSKAIFVVSEMGL